MPSSKQHITVPVDVEINYGPDAFEEAVTTMLHEIGENPRREGLLETPLRVAKMFRDELCCGYGKDPNEVFKTFDSDGYDEMVIVRDIPLVSLCEHHMVPFTGLVHVAYIPGKKVIGLSKIARLVDIFARRLQIQERLTMQIADALEEGLQPRGLGVVIEAEHMCMTIRGVQKPGTKTVTSAVKGILRDVPAAREEFLRLLGRA